MASFVVLGILQQSVLHSVVTVCLSLSVSVSLPVSLSASILFVSLSAGCLSLSCPYTSVCLRLSVSVSSARLYPLSASFAVSLLSPAVSPGA